MCTSKSALFTFTALRQSGHSRRNISARVANGELTSLRRGVYASPSACSPVRTAVLHGGAIACITAARHLGLWTLADDDSVHVWVGGHGHALRHDACACVTHWDLAGSARHDSFGLPSVPAILRQILHCRGVEEFFVTLESAMRRNLLTRAGLAWLRTNVDGIGRDAVAFARSDADSGLESLLRWRLRPHGLRLRTQVSIVSVGIVDFLIGDRLIVEVDGRVNHASESMRHKDLQRDANAAAWGYITLRFDYAMVVHDWETVELAILGNVDRARHLDPIGKRRLGR